MPGSGGRCKGSATVEGEGIGDMRKVIAWAALAMILCGPAATAQDLPEAERRLEEARQAVRDLDATGMPENIKQGFRDLLRDAEADVARLRAEETQANAQPADQPAAAPAAPAPKPAEGLPAELGAGLPVLLSVPLDPPAGRTDFVQVNTRIFLCGDAIVLSYSLRPSRAPAINAIRFSGQVSGPDGTQYPFEAAGAHAEPGDNLGCAHQTVPITSLAQHEKDLIQHTYTNGQEVWSRQAMVEHLLGRFHTRAFAALDPAVATASRGTVANPPSADAALADQRKSEEIYSVAKQRSDEIAAEAARKQRAYEEQQAKFERDNAQYAADKAANDAAVAKAKAAREEYEKRLAEYEASIGKARVKLPRR